VSSYAVNALLGHLWQSTLFVLAVGCLCLLLRRNSARIRYCLWLAASAKFLIPFAALTAYEFPAAPTSGSRARAVVHFDGGSNSRADHAVRPR
jgi:hypothetical protein